MSYLVYGNLLLVAFASYMLGANRGYKEYHLIILIMNFLAVAYRIFYDGLKIKRLDSPKGGQEGEERP